MLVPGNYVIAPVDGLDITAGKKYEVLDVSEDDSIFTIEDDDETLLMCQLLECNNIQNRDWIIS